jgi:hypothetical protein
MNLLGILLIISLVQSHEPCNTGKYPCGYDIHRDEKDPEKRYNACNKSITYLDDDTLRNYTNYTVLDLRYNSISDISMKAFAGLEKLQCLGLQQNLIANVTPGLFDGLGELISLWLQENKIMVLEKGLFKNNTKLEWIYLDSNQIVAISPKLFTNKLKSLDLSNNICYRECKRWGLNEIKLNNFKDNLESCFQFYPTFMEIKKQNVSKPKTITGKENCNNDLTAHWLILSIETTILVLISTYMVIKKFRSTGKLDDPTEKFEEDHQFGSDPELFYATLDLPKNRNRFEKKDDVIYANVKN